jgi:uncharacterized membrane protein
MSHPLVVALFDDPGDASGAARDLRRLGVPPDKVSIVARSHDEEGRLAQAADASPGSEIEDSRAASRLGELGAHLIAAVALVMPGIGPIVAGGPLAAGLGEAAGHLAGSIASALHRSGIPEDRAEALQRAVEEGAVLLGIHVQDVGVAAVREALSRSGASAIETANFPEGA